MKCTRQLLVALLALTLTGQAQALKSDRDQPADIEADDIEFDFKKGTRTYLDNVLAVQGTLRLKADKLVAEYNGSELQKATMWGSLARFKQRPDGKEHDVEGWAKKIIVDQRANTLTLIGKAALKQGTETARGDTIVYNMANDTLRIKGQGKLGSGDRGNQPAKAKLEDPFKDDPLPTSSGQTAEKSSDSSTEDAAAEVEPTRSGRSRLIINPK